jgi:hypothetical protein
MQDNYVKLLRPQARDLGKRYGRNSISAHNLTPNLTPGQESWVQAATFESMRSRAGTTVPGGGPEHWIDPAAFFSRGTSGQWRGLLDDADLARYAARVRALASGNLVEWVHREPID